MIEMQPVLEVFRPDEFTLWPVAWSEPFGYLPLGGTLEPIEVGTAVMRIAEANDVDPEDGRPPRPADALGAFLHGLLTMDPLFAPGGMRVTDTVTGTTLVPGCCSGIEDWREWFLVVDGHPSTGYLGHDPDPLAERHGDIVRLTVDAERDDSPLIELPVTDLRRLLADAERDLIAFHALAASWAEQHIAAHAVPLTAALARALDIRPTAHWRTM
ncbi:hypothetical protein H4W34_002716 [Actinomadura algeriensis]|uniref:SUKH-4 immunity protein of toxin-antitoxin system n=2 Tax=Actinomadura algeriensis TaxID=1679523 RepID=A0ABR9JQN3_9ACTN|nr:hypothetical protein [Actinomadura algeriensis]